MAIPKGVQDPEEKKDKQQDRKDVDDPFAFVMDLLIDMIKSFVNGMKAGYMGLDPDEMQGNKDPMKNMQTMSDSMMKMFQGMQQMQNFQAQMQPMGLQPQQPQATAQKQAGAEKQQAPQTKGAQSAVNNAMPAMNNAMSGMNNSMPGMNNVMSAMNSMMQSMGNMQFNGSRMSGMGGMMGTLMNVGMQMMQTMMTGMMQMQQMYQAQMMQQMQNPQMQNQQQAPQNQQQAPEKQAEQPEKQENGPSEREREEELVNSTKELKEANEEYKQLKAENDAIKAEVGDRVARDEETINAFQAEMDKNIDAISQIKGQKDATLEEDRKSLEKEMNETAKKGAGMQAARTQLAFDQLNPDASPWNEKDLTEAEVSSGKLGEKLKTDGAGKDVLDAVNKYNEELKQFNSKDISKTANAEDTIKTYDAAKNFLNATKPKIVTDRDGTSHYETLSPEMQKARDGAQKIVSSMENKESKIRERAEARAEARANNRQFENTPGKEMNWFSKAELDKAINGLDKMRDANGKLGPGAEKFHGALSELRNNMGKKDGMLNASTYVNVYNAADDFMKESLNGKGGPGLDEARQAGKDVRKRLNENERIDKLRVVSQYEKKMEQIKEKNAKLNEREQAQKQRDKKIEGLKSDMRAARYGRNMVNTEKHQADKKRLDESNKKLEAARQRREAAKSRRMQAEQPKRRSRQTQTNAPQKKAMGM